MDPLGSIFPFVVEVNRKAGQVVRRYFGTELEIMSKPDLSPVTAPVSL